MSYYWFNREEILQKYHNFADKEKAAIYYQENINILKEKTKNTYRNLSEEQKEVKRQYSRNKYKEMKEKQRKYEIMIAEKKLKSHFSLYKMSEQKIKFNYNKVTKKTLYDSAEAIDLYSVDINKIVVSNKWKNNDISKSFIGY